MISLKDKSHVPASPAQVWKCFAEMDAHYRDWHPDHVVWRNIKGNATVPHGVIYADERVGKVRLRGKFYIGRAEHERYFEFKMGFPYSLVKAGGWFQIKPTENGECDLVAETHLGYSAPVIGPLMDRILSACMPLDDLKAHMTDEGHNFGQLLTGTPLRDKPSETRAVRTNSRQRVHRHPRVGNVRKPSSSRQCNAPAPHLSSGLARRRQSRATPVIRAALVSRSLSGLDGLIFVRLRLFGPRRCLKYELLCRCSDASRFSL